jgi:uncharacterized protein YceH (UPF0502 family)
MLGKFKAMEAVLMARREALTPDQWKIAFDAIVADATQELGRVPCMSLQENENGNGVLLVASVTVSKKVNKFLERGTITNRITENVSAHIYKKEIPIVLKLLREYQQPEPDFDANLDFWSLWEEPQVACQNQMDLTRWS